MDAAARLGVLHTVACGLVLPPVGLLVLGGAIPSAAAAGADLQVLVRRTNSATQSWVCHSEQGVKIQEKTRIWEAFVASSLPATPCRIHTTTSAEPTPVQRSWTVYLARFTMNRP